MRPASIVKSFKKPNNAGGAFSTAIRRRQRQVAIRSLSSVISQQRQISCQTCERTTATAHDFHLSTSFVQNRYKSTSTNTSPSSADTSLQKMNDGDSEVADPATVYLPVNFETSAKIEGEESHVVMIQLKPGECVRAESGSMIFMTESIQMNTTSAGASNAFKRIMTGQNVFFTDFTCQPASTDDATGEKPATSEQVGTLCLGTDFPSKILRLNLQDMANETLICQKGAYLASNPTVDIDMEFTKSLSAGFFGGHGFVLQRLSGTGDVLVKAGGTLVCKTLQEGEALRVTSGSIVAFENTIDYDIQMMPGIKNAMFGGEGLFVTKLTGPGRLWLQGLPPDRMISEIARLVPGPGIGLGIPIGMGGGVGDAGAEGAGDEAGAGGISEGAGGDEAVEQQVAATDAAIEADRQATVASSGMAGSEAVVGGETPIDPNSPSALFGDAAGPDKPSSAGVPTNGSDDDSTFMSDSTDTTYDMSSDSDSFSTDATTQPTFDDGSSFSPDDVFAGDAAEFQDDSSEFFGDDPGSSATTDISGDAAGAASEGGSSLLGTLWDLFMGGDD